MNSLSRELLNCLFIEHLNITKLIRLLPVLHLQDYFNYNPGGQDYFNSTDLHLKFIKMKKKKKKKRRRRKRRRRRRSSRSRRKEEGRRKKKKEKEKAKRKTVEEFKVKGFQDVWPFDRLPYSDLARNSSIPLHGSMLYAWGELLKNTRKILLKHPRKTPTGK